MLKQRRYISWRSRQNFGERSRRVYLHLHKQCWATLTKLESFRPNWNFAYVVNIKKYVYYPCVVCRKTPHHRGVWVCLDWACTLLNSRFTISSPSLAPSTKYKLLLMQRWALLSNSSFIIIHDFYSTVILYISCHYIFNFILQIGLIEKTLYVWCVFLLLRNY